MITKSQLQIGDLGFLQSPSTPGINHVGIYAGHDMWIHENGTAMNVSMNNVNFWQFYRRILPD